jgi:hypothetical protein
MKIQQSLQLLALAGLSLSAVSCFVDTGAGTAVVTTETEYRPGYYVRTLPQHEVRVIGGTRYYYHNNVYYRPRGEGYVVVQAPGAYAGTRTEIIRTLPSGYRVVERGGTRYYLAGDTYYRAEGGGYVIVPNPF